MKEAYTKALGVGLGFDFASFQFVSSETRQALYPILVDTITKEGRASEYLSIAAKVEYNMDDFAKNRELVPPAVKLDTNDVWYFVFSPLYDGGGGDSGNDTGEDGSTVNKSIRGCACSCTGPLQNRTATTTTATVQLNEEWMTFDELIKFHNRHRLIDTVARHLANHKP